MWKIYKEGQGKWARGLVATTVGLGALYGVSELFRLLPQIDPMEVYGFSFDYRFCTQANHPQKYTQVIWLLNFVPAGFIYFDFFRLSVRKHCHMNLPYK